MAWGMAGVETYLWVVFIVVFVVLMSLDLGLVDRGEKHIDARKASKMAIAYVAVAVTFGLLVFQELGADRAAEYYAAYAIELSMSVDNLFVFIVIFAAFLVPEDEQHRVLFWGIMGAIFFRAAFIIVGAELLESFDWMMYVFGAVLLYTAYKTAFKKERERKTEDTLPFRLSRKIKSTQYIHGPSFFVKENGKRLATPLFLCLIVIEASDLMFAFDSVPAALAISTDVFIVYTSNIFAIMGLRSMYFVIRDVLGTLYYLKYGLGAILAFIGAKMILAVTGILQVGVAESLLYIIIVLTATVSASVLYYKRHGGRSSKGMEEIRRKHSGGEE